MFQVRMVVELRTIPPSGGLTRASPDGETGRQIVNTLFSLGVALYELSRVTHQTKSPSVALSIEREVLDTSRTNVFRADGFPTGWMDTVTLGVE